MNKSNIVTAEFIVILFLCIVFLDLIFYVPLDMVCRWMVL